jgi:hypothetical protein
MKTQAQEIASYIQEEYEKELNKRNSAESLEKQENSEECSRSERNSGEYFKDSKQAHTKASLTIRINNLQFRSTSQSSGEFIKWSVNPLYNNLLSYLDNGWEDHVEVITKGCVSMQKSLFSLSETCIVIGWLKACPNENCCELTSVGPRILDLTPLERNDFFEVYTLAESKLLTLSNESENEN